MTSYKQFRVYKNTMFFTFFFFILIMDNYRLKNGKFLLPRTLRTCPVNECNDYKYSSYQTLCRHIRHCHKNVQLDNHRRGPKRVVTAEQREKYLMEYERSARGQLRRKEASKRRQQITIQKAAEKGVSNVVLIRQWNRIMASEVIRPGLKKTIWHFLDDRLKVFLQEPSFRGPINMNWLSSNRPEVTRFINLTKAWSIVQERNGVENDENIETTPCHVFFDQL